MATGVDSTVGGHSGAAANSSSTSSRKTGAAIAAVTFDFAFADADAGAGAGAGADAVLDVLRGDTRREVFPNFFFLDPPSTASYGGMRNRLDLREEEEEGRKRVEKR